MADVAQSVAEIVLADLSDSVFWHITEPGVHAVDLPFLSSDEAVLALEVRAYCALGRSRA